MLQEGYNHKRKQRMAHKLGEGKMALSKKTDPYSEMREGVEEGVRARNLSV